MTRAPLRLAAAGILSALALVAAGCGGGSDGETSAAVDWAGGLCSAVTDWQTSITDAGESLVSGGVSEDAITSAVDDAKNATQTLVDDVRGLGAPDTESGQEAKEAVDDLADELESGVNEIEEALDGASGLSGLATAVTSVSGTLTTMASEVGNTFETLESLDARGELGEAFEQAESCQSLAN